MKGKALLAALVLMSLFISGCVEETGEQILYTCSSGEEVLDISMCPDTTTALSSEAPAATSLPVTLLPPTTVPPPSTTFLSATSATSTTTTTTTTISTTTSTTSTSTSTTTMSTTTVTTTTLAPLQARAVLEIVDEAVVQEPNGKFWLGGRVRNSGNAAAYDVQVLLKLYDERGKKLDEINIAPIAVIQPGETLDLNVFKTEILASNVNRYTLTVSFS